MKLTPVILCGGFGSRLWPSSRLSLPKPCLKLTENDLSLLQETLKRIAHLNFCAPIIVCNQRHRFVIAEQVESLKGDYPYLKQVRIILEPSARNTAPAIALAAFQSLLDDPDSQLLVLPADHHILWDERFDQSLLQGAQLAKDGHLVTFGIQPTHPETGYGYIQAGKDFEALAFVEKPNKEKAEAYLLSGDYLWNSGMFTFKAARYLNELKKYEATIYHTCKQAFEERRQNEDFIRINEETFNLCPENSIDYAVMEKSQQVKVIPFYNQWQDLGNWSAVYELSPKDENENHLSGDVISYQSNHCLIKSESRLVTTLGVENLVIIETSDAILVMNKDKSQQMGELITHLKEQNRSEYLTQKVHINSKSES